MSVLEHLSKKKAGLYAAIEQRYACSHEQRELRHRIIGDGRPAFYRQCVRCGHAGQAVSAKRVHKEMAGAPVPDFDDDVANRWAKAKSAEYSLAANEINQEFWLMYEDYLRSPEWKQRRGLVLQRANGICEVCEINEPVDVHHETYEHLCCEPLEDLKAVCKFCHDYLHKKIEL